MVFGVLVTFKVNAVPSDMLEGTLMAWSIPGLVFPKIFCHTIFAIPMLCLGIYKLVAAKICHTTFIKLVLNHKEIIHFCKTLANRYISPNIKWSEFGTYSLCEQFAQSCQNLRCSLIQAVSQEESSDRKPDPWPLWMAGHAQLKFVMTECTKTRIRLTGLKYR